MKKTILLLILSTITTITIAQQANSVTNEQYAESVECAPISIETVDNFDINLYNFTDAPTYNKLLLGTEQFDETFITKRTPDRITAGVLALLLGGIGVQNFYIGNIGIGVLDIIFCWTGIPAIIGLIQGIIWLTEDDESFLERISKN